MRIPRTFLASLLVLAAGCDTAEDDGLYRRADFAVGSALRYERTFATGPTADSLSVDARDTFVMRVADTDAAVEGMSGLVELAYESDYGVASVWYRQRRGALEEVAYESGLALAAAPTLRLGEPGVSPVAAASGWTTAAGSQPSGGVTLREPPRVVVRYPAEVGDAWTHWRIDEAGLHGTREVVGYEDVTTPAGTFRCVVLRSRNYQNGEDVGLEMLDYLSERGLVRRVALSVQEGEDELGNPTGRFVSEERHELIAVEG